MDKITLFLELFNDILRLSLRKIDKLFSKFSH